MSRVSCFFLLWGITAAVYFSGIKHYIQYGSSVFTYVCSIYRQSVIQGVAYNGPICFFLLESFQNFETSIRRRRTLGEPFDVAQY